MVRWQAEYFIEQGFYRKINSKINLIIKPLTKIIHNLTKILEYNSMISWFLILKKDHGWIYLLNDISQVLISPYFWYKKSFTILSIFIFVPIYHDCPVGLKRNFFISWLWPRIYVVNTWILFFIFLESCFRQLI